MQSFHISMLPTEIFGKKGKLQLHSTLLEKIKSSGQARTESILSAPMLKTLGKII